MRFFSTAIIFIATSLALIGCSENEPDEPVDPNEIIVFVMDDTEFRVRRKYMISIGRRKTNDEISNAKLWALLPDFEAYDKDKNFVEFHETLGHGRRLRILLRPGKGGGAENVRDSAKRNGGLTNSDFHGLEEYTNAMTGEKLYFSNSEHLASFYYSCGVDVPSPGCFGSFRVADDISSTTSFAYEYLPMWREIHEGVRLITLDAYDFETN